MSFWLFAKATPCVTAAEQGAVGRSGCLGGFRLQTSGASGHIPKGKKKCPKKGKLMEKKKKRGGKIMELMSRDGQITLESENLNKG